MGSPTAPVPANRILDLHADVGQYLSAFRIDVLNIDNEAIGSLDGVDRDRPPTIANSTTSSIPRTLRGLQVAGFAANDVNPFTDRLRPVLLLEDGSQWPMGVFVWQRPDRSIRSWDSPLSTTLVDLTYLLQQERPGSFNAANRQRVTNSLDDLAADAGFSDRVVQPSDVRVLDPITKLPGTRYAETMGDLCRLCGYLLPYCDNTGTLRIEPAPPLKDGPNVLRYSLDAGPSRCVRDSIVITPETDLPGAYRVINSGPTKDTIEATVLVDPDLPWSQERRGYLVLETVRSQGIETTAQAQAMANSLVQRQPGAGASFDGLLDPRHDTHNIVEFGSTGELWRETGWSAQLEPGGRMHHTLVKSSQP